MSWGTELWDQYDNIGIHTQKGTEFCEKYGHFIKDRCAIEVRYAAELKKLVRNYQPRKKEEDDYQFTCQRGFLQMLKELHDIASQHELIAENLTTNVLKEVQSLIKELSIERKKHLDEGAKLKRHLDESLKQLDRSKRKYEGAYKDMEKAVENFKRADADINLSRAEVEKQKNISRVKTQLNEEAKNEYAAQLQNTNRAQHEHYTVQMPQVFQQIQDMDEKRVTRIQHFIKETGDIERNVIPIINTCIDGIHNAANSINPSKDSEMVIEKFKSGFEHPQDIPFEDLSQLNGSDSSLNTSQRYTPTGGGGNTTRGTVSGRTKKRTGIFGIFSSSKPQTAKTDDQKEDFSHLPPHKQKKKLNEKIDELNKEIVKETAERDGMMKMRDVYVQNPALGDPNTLDKQLEDNAQKLDQLQQELQKYRGFLNEAENKGTPVSDRKKRSSLSDDSTSISSRSTTDLSNASTNQQQGTPNATMESHHSQSSPEIVDNRHVDQQDSFDDGLEFDYAVIGTCKAIYPFEATSDGSISMAQDEEFSIVEQDQGDGWTRVRKNGGEEGFVPTSYIECYYP